MESNFVAMENRSSSDFGGTRPTILKIKRRLEDSPSKMLVASYKRRRVGDSKSLQLSEEYEEVKTVLHLAGSSNNDEISQAEAQDVISKFEKSLLKSDQTLQNRLKLKRNVPSWDTSKDNKNKRKLNDRHFKVIPSMKSGDIKENVKELNSKEDDINESYSDKTNEFPAFMLNLVDIVEDNSTSTSGTVGRNESMCDTNAEVGTITVNGVAMVKQSNPYGKISQPEFVYDLYLSEMCPSDILDNVIVLQPDWELVMEHQHDCNADSEDAEESDDDSNDEGNWRNDYPDSDYDRENSKSDDERYVFEFDNDDEIAQQLSGLHMNKYDNELSSDDEDVYARDDDGFDSNMLTRYDQYKRRVANELSHEVVSSQSESD